MAVTSGGKAYFVNVDGGGTFYVQFNPKELKLEDTASWKSSDEQGKPKPLLTYEKGEAAVLSMDLVFDSTDTGSSVQGRIDALRAFLAATVTDSDEGGESKRPPHINFHWGGFSFEGVCEKISASVLMFKPDGTPMRAKVSVTLKERMLEAGGSGTGAGSQVTLSALGSMISGNAVNATTTTVQPNQTMSQAAAANNTDFRTLAQANPQITNPMEMNAGEQLVVPGNNQLANVLANQALGQTPANFAPVGDLDPFGNNALGDALGGLGDLGAADNDLSTAFQASGLADQATAAIGQAGEAAQAAITQGTEAAQAAVTQASEAASAAVTQGTEAATAAVGQVAERAQSILGNPAFPR